MWFRLNLVARGLLGVWASGACVRFVVHGLCGALADSSMLLLLCPGSSFPSMSKQFFSLSVSEQATIYTFHIPK